MPYCSATALIVYVFGFLVIQAPSPLAGSAHSASNTLAAIPSSLPKSLSARSPALLQTDGPSRPGCEAMVHRARANGTSAPTVFPAECATASFRQPSALRSSRRAQLRER